VTGATTWGNEVGEIMPDDLDDLDDLDGFTFSTAIDAAGTEIAGLDGWKQKMTVQCLDPFNVLQVVADGSSDIIQMEVVVTWNDEEITRLSWIAPR
jgi:hypothetical protein